MVRYGIFGGEEHNGGCGLAGFTVVWPKNRIEVSRLIVVCGSFALEIPAMIGHSNGWVLIGEG